MRSGMMTGLILAAAVVALTIIYHEHMQGNFHKLKAEMAPQRQDVPVPRPGGQEAIVLTRTALAGGSMPEFLSVTMLPGRGMNILQITAYLPEKGEVNLLAAPSVDDAERVMTGKGPDEAGAQSLAIGSPFEVPWAGRIWGTASQDRVTATWHGHTISLPATGENAGGAVSQGGLLLLPASTSADTSAMPDGGQAEATFEAGDFGAHWPSKTDVDVTVLLGSQSIELTVVAHNRGEVAEPIGIGWHPRFAIRGDRQQLRLRLPGQMREETRQGGLPTGTLLPVAGTSYDFTAHDGERLGNINLNDTFVKLHQELLDSGPLAELSDPANNYRLRLTALSSTIQAMHVDAPAGGNFVSIQPRYNLDDPLGREWSKDTDNGMVILQPGQSTQWQVRLELLSVASGQPPL